MLLSAFRLLSTLLICLGIVSRGFGSLSAQDASDGSCLPSSQLLPFLHKETNVITVGSPGTYYIPMGSKALYRHYAEGLLGRPAEDQTELDSMQITLVSQPFFITINNTGFFHLKNPPAFGQTCIFTAIPSFKNLGLRQGKLNVDSSQAVCIGLKARRPDGTVSLQPSKSFVNTLDSVIWTNEDVTIAAIYRCPADGIKDFKVISKTKTISADVIETIKAKMAPLGFSEDSMAYLKYA